MDLVAVVYKVTGAFPKSETYELVSQMRRAAIAIPSNIAEGYIRRHAKEYAQFISIAYSSGAELETQLEISQRLSYINKEQYQTVFSLLQEVMRMLNKLEKVLRSSKN